MSWAFINRDTSYFKYIMEEDTALRGNIVLQYDHEMPEDTADLRAELAAIARGSDKELGACTRDVLPVTTPATIHWDSVCHILTVTKTETYEEEIHRFTCLPMDDPIPLKEGTRRTAIQLKSLHAIFHRRPKPGDKTVRGYISRQEVPVTFTKLPLHFPHKPKQIGVYHDGVRDFVVIDWTKRVLCRVCKKESKMLNGRVSTQPQRYGQKICCFGAPRYVELKTHLTHSIFADSVVCITYDIETTSFKQADGAYSPHKVFCVCALDEAGQRYCFWSAEEFINFVMSKIAMWERYAEARQATEKNSKKVLLQLVSFNGGRFDDLFLIDYWRDALEKKYGLSQYMYRERKGAITHNNFRTPLIEVEFTDLTRFTPPCSLAKVAMDYKLTEQKGSIPFEALNDYTTPGKKVRRDIDGFFALAYFQGDEIKRAAALAYYRSFFTTPPVVQDDQDLVAIVVEYCHQDVATTFALYRHLNHMFSTYLAPLLTGIADFLPMNKHSLPTIASQVMFHSALTNEVDVYNSRTGTTERKCPTIFSPVGPTYDFERGAQAGGWVKPYFMGLVVNSANFKEYTSELAYNNLVVTTNHNDVALLEANLGMMDVVSEYPVAVSGMMPVSAGRLISSSTEQRDIIDQLLACDNCMHLPLFIARCKMTPPSRPYLFESTLWQRTKSGDLSWTYDAELGEQWQEYCSMDLWLACRASCVNNDPESLWSIKDIKEMVYFEEGAAIYKEFMQTCAQGKKDGGREKNPSKREVFKLALNSSIGKMGQIVTGTETVIGDQKAQQLFDSLGSKVALTGCTDRVIRRGNLDTIQQEFKFRVKDNERNKMPQSHAAFMYAYSRYIRLLWAIATLPPTPLPIIEREYPDTFYGDTDSKIQLQEDIDRLPPKFLGDEIGFFQANGEPSFNLEAEKVCDKNMAFVLAGFLCPKIYFVLSYNRQTRKPCLKLKCKGIRLWDAETSACHLHRTIKCHQCMCPHDNNIYTCIQCIFENHHTDFMSSDTKDYKYHEITHLTFIAFLKTLLSGSSIVTQLLGFTKTLSLATSKYPDFSVINTLQTRSLNRPLVLDNMHTKCNVPHLRGCVSASAKCRGVRGVVYPAGDYLYAE